MARHDHSTTHSVELVKPMAAGTTKPTRRGVIGALAATMAAPPALAARAAAVPVDPLEAMWAEYLERDAACEAAYEAMITAERAATLAAPARPASLVRKCRNRDTGETWDHPLSREDISKEIGRLGAWGGRRALEVAARWSLKLRLYDRWWAACDAADRAHRVDELAEIAEAARGAVLDRIRATPARTAGVALVKLRAIHAWAGASQTGDSYAFPIDPREVMQVIRDLECISAATPTLSCHNGHTHKLVQS